MHLCFIPSSSQLRHYGALVGVSHRDTVPRLHRTHVHQMRTTIVEGQHFRSHSQNYASHIDRGRSLPTKSEGVAFNQTPTQTPAFAIMWCSFDAQPLEPRLRSVSDISRRSSRARKGCCFFETPCVREVLSFVHHAST